jgi:hypothetical protein
MANPTLLQVVPFAKPTDKITQLELALLATAKYKLRQLETQAKKSQQSIMARLKSGVEVEVGLVRASFSRTGVLVLRVKAGGA